MAEKESSAFPTSLPSLARAQRATEWAAGFGFDWPAVEPVWKKVEEEWDELKSAAASGDRRRTGEEMGDLLLSLVNLSRFLDLEAEASLSEAVERFLRRFGHVRDRIREMGKNPSGTSLEEMDLYWEEAKRLERKRP